MPKEESSTTVLPTDPQQRAQRLELLLRRILPNYRKLQEMVRRERRRRHEAENLLKVHPDTGLPIYRYLLQDLDMLTGSGTHAEDPSAESLPSEDSREILSEITREIQDTGIDADGPHYHDEQIPEQLKLSDASGCAGEFELSDLVPQRFCLMVIRLDDAYGRIKNSRDRTKALLYKSTLRLKMKLDQGCLYQSDRLDEFYILYPQAPSAKRVEKLLESLIQAVAQPHDPPAEDIRFSALGAATLYPDDGETSESLLINLEVALNEAEHNGKRYRLYTDEIGRKFRYRRQVETELHNAIQGGFDQFHLVFQPFCRISGKIVGAEVLVRWRHPNLGDVSPGLFIPIAEANGSIRLIGRWILYQACRQLSRWIKEGMEDLYLSVNLSPVQFSQKDLVDSVLNILKANGLGGRHIKLELTEGTIMSNPNESIEKMSALRNAGIRLSIDDFGTGYSSLNYLRKLPVNTLKIDKSFIDDVVSSQDNQEIVRAIISLAHSLKIETIAEGVEYKPQLDFLEAEGAEYIQGYYFSPPVDADTFQSYLSTGGVLPLS
ncbi:putative bifunctional diguanylate cyclase/phosphodiesterase [Spirochaeta lutea]|uniref:putative bifunctional diguanylate cyclase/phosphodiesterase n=1 Tax=Spirochaeta lutea TaxID=1480694 RepID=UPI0009DFCC44|nr:GGDEF domain-containing phosphodiesterase [Spirochaeta lutea]